MAKAYGAYVADNPKYRRAWIRDRLQSIKAERETLIAERNAIETLLRSSQAATVVMDSEVILKRPGRLFAMRA